jgi:hypothetical protein
MSMAFDYLKEQKTQLDQIHSQIQRNINSRLSNLRFRVMERSEFDEGAGTHSINQITFVVSVTENPDTHENDTVIELYKGDNRIEFTGGGVRGIIATAAILSSEQMRYWAPDHALLPVEFRGGSHMYYSQPRAKIVIQGQHAIVPVSGASPTADEEDLYEEIIFDFDQNGQTVQQKLKIMVASMTRQIQNNAETCTRDPLIMVSQLSGSTETLIGYYNMNSFTVSSDTDFVLGMFISVTSLTNSNNEPINPKCVIYAAYKTESACTILGVPANISGSLFNPPFDVKFANDAERNFALGIAGIVEPELSNGGDSR